MDHSEIKSLGDLCYHTTPEVQIRQNFIFLKEFEFLIFTLEIKPEEVGDNQPRSLHFFIGY